jgi:transposase
MCGMLKVRIVTTASGANAVQIVRYVNRRRVLVKHIGSAHSQHEIETLLTTAQDWIKDYTHQLSVFTPSSQEGIIRQLANFEYLGFYYSFLYEVLDRLQERIGYRQFKASILNDLVTIRVIEPASKLRSIELIETYFGIKHRRQSFYEAAPRWLQLKNQVEETTVAFATKEFSFDYSLVFYDVTTLYFETFEADELRKHGFSKDSKSQQPQILVALMVTKEGFPIAYEVFPGNTFEGHTMIPVIKSFIKNQAVKTLTVVADAAMISANNIEELKGAEVNYIVGARLGNLSMEMLDQINQQLIRSDESSIRIATDKGFLICSFSQKRFYKDKYEMEKHIQKAKFLIKQPSKGKKAKFIRTGPQKLELNEDLISKTNKLLGVKGYYTNLPESVITNSQAIQRYHDLYKIEQAFRVSKNDLKTRPVFHFKEGPIKLHMLICFMALAVSKLLELKTGTSLRSFLTQAKKITDARLLNTTTKTESRIRTKTSPTMAQILKKLNLPH